MNTQVMQETRDQYSSEDAARKRRDLIGHYTIFDPKVVLRPSAEEILDIAMALGQRKISRVVSYQPERIALHRTLANIITSCSRESEADLSASVHRVMDSYVLSAISEKSTELISRWKEKQSQTLLIIKENRVQELTTEEQEVYKTISNNMKESSPERIAYIAAACIADHWYRSADTTREIIKLSDEAFQSAINDNAIRLVTPLARGERSHIIMLAAGPGSGKSTYIASGGLTEELAKSGLNKDDYVHVMGDKLPSILKSNYFDAYSAVGDSLALTTRDESSYIMTECVYPMLFSKLGSSVKHPFTVIERGSGIQSTSEALAATNAHAHYIFIHVPTSLAKQRASTRAGIKISEQVIAADHGKIVPESEMNTIHAEASQAFSSLPNISNHCSFELLNNSTQDAPPSLTAHGNLQTKTLAISDIDALSDFLAKSLDASEPTQEQRLLCVSEYCKKFNAIEFVLPQGTQAYCTIYPKDGRVEIHAEHLYNSQFKNNSFRGIHDALLGIENPQILKQNGRVK